jgi:2-oxoisovalerate dehydrogenase E1 component alpha subunit
MVSRLRGHSSASGANLVKDEIDCLDVIEQRLEARSLLTRAQMAKMREDITNELADASKIVRTEPQPEGQNIWDYVFADKNIVGGEH